MLLMVGLLPMQVQAATAKRLFTLQLQDGTSTRKIQVYQYTEKNGSFYVAAKKSLRTINVPAGTKSVSVSVINKTSLYKKNYRSITYKKRAALSDVTSLRYILKTRKGEQKEFIVKAVRPSVPTITSLTVSPNESQGFITGGNNRLTVKLNMKSSTAVKSFYKVTNSSGKIVYQKTLGTRKSTNYTHKWNGKPSKGNAAGLSASSYIPTGTYKLTAYVAYTSGSKTQYVTKTVPFKVKKASTASGSTSGSTNNSGTTGNAGITGTAVSAKNWSWKMTLTGDNVVDYLAEQVCQEVLNNNMTEIQRARALYNWIDKNLYHVSGQPSKYQPSSYKTTLNNLTASAEVAAYGKYVKQLSASKAAVDSSDGYFGNKAGSGMQKTKMAWLKSCFILKKGDCLIASAAYQTLLRHAGIEAHIVENDSSAGHHFWNVVKIGGKYYYTDVDRTIYDTKMTDNVSYVWFLRGTNTFYKEKLYSTVMKNKTKYAIANQVSASDCPGRY